MTGQLPPIDTAMLPAEVRKAGPQAQKLYETALAFESVLTQQLTQQLTDSVQSADGDESSSSTALVTQMLPQSLSQSVTSAGGLGLAQQLYESLGGGTQEQTS
jgi:Rod binding domain-containing protein